MSTKIEIQTIEGGRLEWVAIASFTNDNTAVRWGNTLLSGFGPFDMKPSLRTTDFHGHVTGAWQAAGYDPLPSSAEKSEK